MLSRCLGYFTRSTLIHSCYAGGIHRGWLKHKPLWVSQRQPQSQPWDPNDPSEASVGSNRKRPCHFPPPNTIFWGSRTESIFIWWGPASVSGVSPLSFLRAADALCWMDRIEEVPIQGPLWGVEGREVETDSTFSPSHPWISRNFWLKNQNNKTPPPNPCFHTTSWCHVHAPTYNYHTPHLSLRRKGSQLVSNAELANLSCFWQEKKESRKALPFI